MSFSNSFPNHSYVFPKVISIVIPKIISKVIPTNPYYKIDDCVPQMYLPELQYNTRSERPMNLGIQFFNGKFKAYVSLSYNLLINNFSQTNLIKLIS